MLTRTKEYLDGGGQAPLLIFDNDTGKQVDFDFRGSAQEVLDRVLPAPPRRGPGRPRLGVISGEVTLMPRHWEWLERQPRKASGTIRRLVEGARRNEAPEARSRRRIEAAGSFLWSIAGNLAGFEEASRALYRRDWATLEELTAGWPPDLRGHLWFLLRETTPSEPEPSGGTYRVLPAAPPQGLSSGNERPESGRRRPWQRTATELAGEIAAGRVTAREAIDAHLGRVRDINPRVNALTSVFAEEAKAAARQADRLLASGGQPGVLAGVPFTVKDNIDVAGHPTTHGVAALREAVAPLDAPLVARLRDAGAIPIGHTNLPDLSLRFHTWSSLFGATLNPWARDSTPGGSSGGEAVALATGMSCLGLGNDAGGSLRLPALFNGVTALKPGYGRFAGDRSVGPRDSTLASQLIPVEGVLARSVVDLHLAFQILAGCDPRDPRVAPAPLWGPPPAQPVRVAVVASPGGRSVHPEVAAALETAAEALRMGGYETEAVDLPSLPEVVEAYGRLIMTEFHQSRELFERLMGEEGRRYLALAKSLHEPTDLAGYLAVTARRQGLQREWAHFFSEYPVVLAPVFTEPVVPADFDIRGPEEHRHVAEAMRLCSATSFVGVPAVAVPTGIAGGQPQGVQVIAGFYREDLCLEAAAAIESRLGRFTPIDPQW